MEPMRVLFYLVVGIMIVLFIFIIYNVMVENLTKLTVKEKEVSADCLKYCKCTNQAECLTAECTWVKSETDSTKGECKKG